MKTLKTLFATVLIAITVCFSSFAADSNVSSIRKIIVKGNAKIVLVQKDKESVNVLESIDSAKSNIKMVGNTLMVVSTEESPITVMVYVRDLFRVEAFDNANISVRGQLNLPYLQVLLHDNAKASINVISKGVYSVIDDKSTLKLKGVSNEHIVLRSKISRIQMDNFVCVSTTSTNIKDTVIKSSNQAYTSNKLALKN
jgi:hypothetical protein